MKCVNKFAILVGTLNKELEPDDNISFGSLMKRSIILALLCVFGLISLGKLTEAAEAPQVVHAAEQTVKEEEVEEVVIPVEMVNGVIPKTEWDSLDSVAKTKLNPYNCDLEKEIVRSDTGECKKIIPKSPVQSVNKPSSSVSTPSPVTVGTTCNEWKAQAGIPNTHATNTLINNESGCKWWARNRTSGACGIPQAWPCSKLPCPLTEAGAVCQLIWMDNYIKGRYGSWEAALNFWYAQCGTSKGCWY